MHPASPSTIFQQRRKTIVATLKVLIDQHSLKTSDIDNEVGKKSMVSQVLSGKKRLSRDHIERLAARFDISATLFFG